MALPGSWGALPVDWGLGVRKYGRTAFGHGGLGGSIALCDPESGLSLAITVNKLTLGRSCTRRIVHHVCDKLRIARFDGLDDEHSTV